MKGDFTRDSFDPTRHFSAVLMQQGRVMLDADHNEQMRIQLHLMRMLTRDLYGSHGGPQHGGGFALRLHGSPTHHESWTLEIGAGHYYVNGVLCESEKCSYDKQPHLKLEYDPLSAWLEKPVAGHSFQIYLDVWERHVSWVEDGSIRETALDGPDTCTRSQVIWQVKSAQLRHKQDEEGAEHRPWVAPSPVSTGRMAARLEPVARRAEPGTLPPDTRYRGAQNQLYRVEVHAGTHDAGGPSFKWSRDNGSLAVPILRIDSSDDKFEVVVPHTIGFDGCKWIELLDDDTELAQRPGLLVKVLKVGFDRLTLEPGTILEAQGPARHPLARRWDQRDNDAAAMSAGAVRIVASSSSAAKDTTDWMELEDGVQVRFTTSGEYRTGDYWQIPARVGTGRIEWPLDEGGHARERAPFGVEHHYAPLGLLHLRDEGPFVTDHRILRHPLRAVTEPRRRRSCLERFCHWLKSLF